MTSDEKFFAWLDGELSGAEADEVERQVAADPALQKQAEAHRVLQARLAQAFDPIAAAPLPERLQGLLGRSEGEVVDFAAARQGRAAARRWGPPQWAAIAATLVIGMVAGTMMRQGTDAPVAMQGGKLYAAAALDDALDTQLASAPGGDVRIGLTFRDRGGAICRSFTQVAGSGLACRDGDRWQLRGLFAAPEGQAGPYRMAGAADPNLAALIDSTRAGEPFNSDEERASQARGWR
jgi:hypothetical protein